MFAKLSTLAFLLPLVSALTLNIPTDATTGGTVTITWTASTTDPAYFSLLLVNPVFHDTFAIANNVQTSLGTITITLPQVPVDGNYNLEAIATNDVNTVYSETGTFAVGAASSSSTTAASTTSSATTTGTTTSGTVTTPSTTATNPASSVSTVSSASTSGTSTGASATPSTFSSGAAPFKAAGIAPAAALVLSAIAGAAMVF